MHSDLANDENIETSGAMTRREVLTKAVQSTGTGLLLLLPMVGAKFPRPAEADTGAGTALWTAAGKAAKFPQGQPRRTEFPNGAVLYITRLTPATLSAVSAKCTHRGCEVGWNKAAKQFVCPCHGAAFAPGGKSLHGPTRHPEEALDPLPSVPVAQKNGQVLVNLKAVPAPALIPGH